MRDRIVHAGLCAKRRTDGFQRVDRRADRRRQRTSRRRHRRHHRDSDQARAGRAANPAGGDGSQSGTAGTAGCRERPEHHPGFTQLLDLASAELFRHGRVAYSRCRYDIEQHRLRKRGRYLRRWRLPVAPGHCAFRIRRRRTRRGPSRSARYALRTQHLCRCAQHHQQAARPVRIRRFRERHLWQLRPAERAGRGQHADRAGQGRGSPDRRLARA